MQEVWTERSPGARTGARAPTRASKAEEEGGQSLKRRNTFVETARERGAARFTSHESRQHRAAAGARARHVSRNAEVEAVPLHRHRRVAEHVVQRAALKELEHQAHERLPARADELTSVRVR